MTTDVLVIGGGPAGMAAALAAKENGAERVLVVEREEQLGGILNQCIHTGFGIDTFDEELSGPEFAGRYIQRMRETDIAVMLKTMVVSLSKERIATVQNEDGIQEIHAKAVVLAMGCRERSRGAIGIPGTRPAGIYSAGTAQKLINSCGYLPGRRAVILGSGDIGLIMARRLTLEGAKVEAVCELLPYSCGLKRNIVQCLEDFDIPLLLSHTVTRIFGTERICGVEITQVDADKRPIAGSERRIDCDMLLLSVGLIPENELCVDANIQMDCATGGPLVNERLETSAAGIYACGNELHVHDLADYAAQEGGQAGKYAAEYARRGIHEAKGFTVCAGSGIHSVVPQRVSAGEVVAAIRVARPAHHAKLVITSADSLLKTVKKSAFTPGEMIRVKITGITSDLKVELREEGGIGDA